MRKAAVAIGFGAFFLTMALLMRFYAYPKLAVVPLDLNTKQTLKDSNASFFDADHVKAGSGPIVTDSAVVADKEASKKASKELNRDVVVLNQWQSTDNYDAQGKTQAPPIDAFTQRYAIDRHTGEAVQWSGGARDGQPFTNYSGAMIKLPFHVGKNRSYDYWDTTLKRTFPIKYVSTEKIDGMTTYKFTQDIPRTKFATRDVPGEVFGLPRGGQVADRYYWNTRTIWVDPETGVMMKLEEKQHQTLEVPNAKPVNAMTTTSVFTPETIKANVDEYKTKSSQLHILRVWAPLLLALLGLFALGLGLLMSLRAGNNRRAGRHEEVGVAPESYDEHRDGDTTFVQEPGSRGSHQLGDGSRPAGSTETSY